MLNSLLCQSTPASARDPAARRHPGAGAPRRKPRGRAASAAANRSGPGPSGSAFRVPDTDPPGARRRRRRHGHLRHGAVAHRPGGRAAGAGGADRRPRRARERRPQGFGPARDPLPAFGRGACSRRKSVGPELSGVSAADYRPADRLHLGCSPCRRTRCSSARCNLVRASRGVSLRYADAWLNAGFRSQRRPAARRRRVSAVRARKRAAGAVDDARPDRWGERVIRFLDKPPRLSLLEYLYFAGDDRFGALGVSTSRDGVSATTARAVAGARATRPRIQRADPQRAGQRAGARSAKRRLIAPGVTMGGARPKALLDIDGDQWVVKFSDGEPTDTPLVEHAAMTLARKADIRVAATHAVRLVDGHAVAVKRFDREHGRRMHCLDGPRGVARRGGAVRLSGARATAAAARRGGGDRYVRTCTSCFAAWCSTSSSTTPTITRRTTRCSSPTRSSIELAPAYDVLPSGQALGFQQMRVGEHEADSTLANALSMAQLFELNEKQAAAQVRRVARRRGRLAATLRELRCRGARPRATRRADRSTVSRGPAPRLRIATGGRKSRWLRTQRSIRSWASSQRSRIQKCARRTRAAATITASTSRTFAPWRSGSKTQPELALALGRATAARLLATLVCKPKALSAAELDAMIRDIRSPKLLDWFIVNVVKPGRHAEELRLRWKDGDDLGGVQAGASRPRESSSTPRGSISRPSSTRSRRR